MGLFKENRVYKPFIYPWADELENKHQKMFWHPDEVELSGDVRDWNTRLTPEEKNLLTHIFRFFTQGDIDVSKAYIKQYGKCFNNAEVNRMMADFAARENIHIRAYSLLLETVGMPEKEYTAFMEYKAMLDKHKYVGKAVIPERPNKLTVEWLRQVAKSIAVFSGFTEGMQLYSSFAILLNFKRNGKMLGMGDIVAWSQRDEALHVEGMIKVFRTLCSEHPEIVTNSFKKELYDIARDMVELEDKFVDLAFELGGIDGLEKDEVKQYVRHITDDKLIKLGLKANYGVDKNPLPWVDLMIESVEHANFFETTPTAYTKGGITW